MRIRAWALGSAVLMFGCSTLPRPYPILPAQGGLERVVVYVDPNVKVAEDMYELEKSQFAEIVSEFSINLSRAGYRVVNTPAAPHDLSVECSGTFHPGFQDNEHLTLELSDGQRLLDSFTIGFRAPDRSRPEDVAMVLADKLTSSPAFLASAQHAHAAQVAASVPTPAPRAAPTKPSASGGLVVVLPVDTRDAQTDAATKRIFEEEIRTVVGNVLSPRGMTVLTGETTLAVLQDNGVDASKVCEASCALSAARELKAKLFVSGTLARSEGEFVAFVRLFDSATGRQLGSVELEGATVRDLRKEFEKSASQLFPSGMN